MLTTATPVSASAPPTESEVPDIVAKSYAIKVVRRSNTNRTYLFEDIGQAQPAPGRLILLKREAEPVMAFRILRTYTERQQFAAKRVRRYGEWRMLANGDVYRAVEKLSDIAAPPETNQDRREMRELEQGEGLTSGGSSPGAIKLSPLPKTEKYDPELDTGTSPPPISGVDSEASELPISELSPEEEDQMASLIAEDILPLIQHGQGVNLQIGLYKNLNSEGVRIYPMGATLKYSVALGKMMFVRKARVQDALAPEFGLGLYKLSPYRKDAKSIDSYTVMMINLELHYRLYFGDTHILFFSLGATQNRVVGFANPNAKDINTLSALNWGIGTGLNFRIGPNWSLRIDAAIDPATLSFDPSKIGVDHLGLGLVLNF